MLMEGIRPDEVALVTVLSACSHTGQVDLGIEYFKFMKSSGLSPMPEHYSCLVDLFCRAGELDKAWTLIDGMPHYENGKFTVSLWGALLSACSDYGNVSCGRLAAQRALELDPQNVGIYVLLSNMYARHQMWKETDDLRDLIKGTGLRKDVGTESLSKIKTIETHLCYLQSRRILSKLLMLQLHSCKFGLVECLSSKRTCMSRTKSSVEGPHSETGPENSAGGHRY
ncbi:hypothetical protein ACET3Z_003445 [Daucus carota]